jgi:uncharacterized membrane protein
MPKPIDIAALLQFTSGDLDLNRQGKLSSDQIGRLQFIANKQRIYYLLVLGFAVILSIVITLMFAATSQTGLSIATAVLAIIGLIGGLAACRSGRLEKANKG